jgi:signal transduction histidine kinase
MAVLLVENRLLRGAFTTDRLDAVTLIAGQLAVSLDNARLYGELTTSRARIVAAGDQARQRIERDLHDGAQQRLVSLALRLRLAQVALPPESGERSAELDSLVSEATSALDELRELARGIHPVVLVEGGLPAALEALALRSAIPVELNVAVGERLPEQVEIAAYYAVSEALTNAAKHADASTVQVQVDTVERDGADLLRVEVRDDGCGGAAVARGTGLLGLKDRVEALGGRILLRSPPGSGTTLRLELPLTTPHGGATLPPDLRDTLAQIPR